MVTEPELRIVRFGLPRMLYHPSMLAAYMAFLLNRRVTVTEALDALARLNASEGPTFADL